MIQPLVKKTIVEDIIDQILHLIDTGQLKPGTRMISERELARQFQVSRTSVREAMKILSFSGIVTIKPGDGTYINETPSTNEIVNDISLNSSLLYHKVDYQQIAEARRILEVQISRLSATRATDDSLEELSDSVLLMKKYLDAEDFDTYTQEDLNFHRILAKACQNDILYNALESIWHNASTVVLAAAVIPGRNLRSYEQHCQMLEAVKEGDADRMEQLMEAHMDYADENIHLYFDALKKEKNFSPQ